MQYLATVNYNICRGTYAWCGNNYNDETSGYYLSSINDTNMTHFNPPTNNIMITINVEMNDELYNAIDIIEIYDINGGLIQYSKHPFESQTYVYKTKELANIQLGKEQSSFPKTTCEDRKIKDFSISQIQKSLPAFFMSTNTYNFFFAIDKKFCGTELSMRFNKIIGKSETSLGRAKMSTILEYKITVPLIEIKGDTKCSICLEHVDDNNNTCVLNCKHVFHMDCIYQYIKLNNLLKPLDKMCKRFGCPHTEKVLQFPCPICNTII